MVNHEKEFETLFQINELIKACIHTNPKDGIKWGMRSLEWASSKKVVSVEMANIYNSIGSCFLKLGLFTPSIEYYQKGIKIFNDLDLLPQIAWTNISIGNVYFKNKLFNLAGSRYKKSLNIFLELNDTNGIALTNLNLGLIANELGEKQKANKYIEESFQFRKNNEIPFIRAETYYYYGVQFKKNNDIDNAILNIKKSIEICENVCEEDLISKYIYQLGLIHFDLQYYQEAKQYFKKCVQFSDVFYQINSKIKIAEILFFEEHNTKAKDNLLCALSLAKEHNILEIQLEINEKLRIYFENNLQYQISNLYLKNIIKIKDSLQNASIIESITNSEILLEIKNWSHQLELKDIQVSQKNTVINYWILAFTLGVSLLILIIKIYQSEKRHSNYKRKQEQKLHLKNMSLIEKENQNIIDQLEIRRRDLTSKSLDIIENDKFLSAIEKQIDIFKNTNSSKVNFIKTMHTIISSRKKHVNYWYEFQLMLVEIYPEFEEKLKQRFPALNQNDIQLCGLLKLGFSSKMISEIRNVSIRAIEQHRYRLRKKMALDKNKKLPEILNEI